MNEIDEEFEKLKLDHAQNLFVTICRKALFNRAFYEMGNMELIEVGQSSAIIQCSSCLKHVWQGVNMCQCGVCSRPNQSTLDRIREAFAALKTLYYRTRDAIWRGMKSGHNPWQKDHHTAMDAKRRVQKRGKYTSIMDRWQNDEVYRESQLVHGWTDWVKYLDYISEIDISHNAPYRQRLRFENTVYMRGVDSNEQAGPLCQRPDFKSSANAHVSLRRAQGKGVLDIPIKLLTRQDNTLNPAVQQHFEWLSEQQLVDRHGQLGNGCAHGQRTKPCVRRPDTVIPQPSYTMAPQGAHRLSPWAWMCSSFKEIVKPSWTDFLSTPGFSGHGEDNPGKFHGIQGSVQWQQADSDVDSGTASCVYRYWDRPVLVSIVLVWCVDRFLCDAARPRCPSRWIWFRRWHRLLECEEFMVRTHAWKEGMRPRESVYTRFHLHSCSLFPVCHTDLTIPPSHTRWLKVVLKKGSCHRPSWDR